MANPSPNKSLPLPCILNWMWSSQCRNIHGCVQTYKHIIIMEHNNKNTVNFCISFISVLDHLLLTCIQYTQGLQFPSITTRSKMTTSNSMNHSHRCLWICTAWHHYETTWELRQISSNGRRPLPHCYQLLTTNTFSFCLIGVVYVSKLTPG